MADLLFKNAESAIATALDAAKRAIASDLDRAMADVSRVFAALIESNPAPHQLEALKPQLKLLLGLCHLLHKTSQQAFEQASQIEGAGYRAKNAPKHSLRPLIRRYG